jgi:23S rRNA (cytosine1962-C5)-methyltransferase
MTTITLKRGREDALLRFHPWVFSGAIHQKEDKLKDGEIVRVASMSGQTLGIGHYQDGSITVRVFAFGDKEINQEFWNEKIQNAYNSRQLIGLTNSLSTNCYRLVHAEGDGLPGLIVDIYGDTAVIQCHSIGMYRVANNISTALQTVFGEKLNAVYNKSKETLPRNFAMGIENRYHFGASKTNVVLENDCKFSIDWETGQKTGFFLDQRNNRALLGHYSKGKTVLNAFCYTGGFSIYALKEGAKRVDSVDVSEKAMELTKQNVALNNFTEGENHHSFAEDVMDFLKKNEKVYDVMIVDPPAFAKTLDKRHNAVQAYKRLNAMALKQIAPNGILFTFSCSQVVDRDLFYGAIVAAAIEAGRQVRVLHQLSQPQDHPVSLFHPEGSYLKGLVLHVE